MVDTVLYFEQNEGDTRFLRATKNRFGSMDEIGIFTMGEQGLTMVEDPSLFFLVSREGDLPPGVATAAVLEGTRPLLVEIQALTVPAKSAMSRVFSDCIDQARVSRVAAILEKHLGTRLSDQDLYINVAGGIRITEVGVELALASALYSARTGLPLPAKIAIAGELSLAGEVRPLRRLPARIKASRNLGFEKFLGPRSEHQVDMWGQSLSTSTKVETNIITVTHIKSAIKMLGGDPQSMMKVKGTHS
jgi:DNA repair protein RadA/Sms